ncbi:MAG: hypothetical protein ACI9SI_001281 [Polaribacter sp.]
MNLSIFIEDSTRYLKRQILKLLLKARKVTGLFLENTKDFDYGDAIRTICNTADEDEKKLELVGFNFFKRYTKGFFQELKNSTKDEKNLFL